MSYVPRVGDKVRATNGENVLVGEVVEHDDDREWFDLYVTDVGGQFVLCASDGWTFERVVEPVTFKPLMVVRLADDALKVLHGDGEGAFSTWEVPPEFVNLGTGNWYGHGPSNDIEFDDDEIQKLLAVGKAEVLFEGVPS